MDVFSECQAISALLDRGEMQGARDAVIDLLDRLRDETASHDELVNHLVRSVGLFPYIRLESAAWEDRFAVEAFKVDVGEDKPVALHIEQSRLLNRLLEGASVAVSAPTSFGKSFVIDAFIAVNKPKSVLVIVPTIALMDETRRRLQRKFSTNYQIITSLGEVDTNLAYIMVCPQERAIGLASEISELDLLIVDEFYKASVEFDQDRSAALVRAIVRFSSISRQRYFLAPNVSSLRGGALTQGMEFIKLDFNTVLLKVRNLFQSIAGDEGRKVAALHEILKNASGKTLIYAGTYSKVESVSNLLCEWNQPSESLLLRDFGEWLRANYGANWQLPELVSRGIGVHNGQLHRPLSQIQVRLFEEDLGLRAIISTSSIIEGVNTSAENVVLWSARNGAGLISDFDFRNIAGRSGRMLRHFVGNVYVLEEPPPETDTQLRLDLPDCLLGLSDINTMEFSAQQRQKSDSFRGDLAQVMPPADVHDLLDGRQLQSSNTELIRNIAQRIASNPSEFRALRFLNSSDPERWTIPLLRVINLDGAGWEGSHTSVVSMVKVLALNWRSTIPEMLANLSHAEVTVDRFFKLERLVTFRLASLIGDLNALHAKIVPDRGFDVSPFVARLSNSFLPPVVSRLEEYGLPRMVSRIIQNVGVIDFEAESLTVTEALDTLRKYEHSIMSWTTFGDFERYLLAYFFDGIRGR